MHPRKLDRLSNTIYRNTMKSSQQNAKARKLHILLFTVAASISSHRVVVDGFTTPSYDHGPRRHGTSSSSAIGLQEIQNPYSEFSGQAGESALQQVQFLASKVAESTAAAEEGRKMKTTVSKNDSRSVRGTGGNIFNNEKYKQGATLGVTSMNNNTLQVSADSTSSDQVWTALANLELDMQMLDTLAGQKPQLTALEFTLLSLTVAAAGSGPLISGGALTEFLAPAACALSAAIGIGAEYVGRVNVADGKEVAAATLQCAAEAEGLLANAERSKCITPLCVGIGASVTTIALLVPVLLETAGLGDVVITEVYLACPLISVLAAAVASLALQETRFYCQRAISVGNRRWARSGLVGRSWLSASEQITNKSRGARNKWKTFSLSVLPAPIFGALIPGAALATKAVIIAAFAAAQSAYFLAQCEFWLARATDAVAIKSRSAAVCDTYANQGARSAAILPFTSALSGLCAAATAAIVELPFVEALSAAGTASGIAGEMAAVTFFPVFSALFAAAASVSKARCEVHAEAATQAASTLALEYTDGEDPILRPFEGVLDLVQLTYASSIKEPFQRFFRRIDFVRRIRALTLSPFRRLKRFFQWKKKEEDNDEPSMSEQGGTPALV